MKNVRVLHFSTYKEDCGISKYLEQFIDSMNDSEVIVNEVFEVSPNRLKTMNEKQKMAVFLKLENKLKSFDILHVQHEFSFYLHDEFELACATAKKLRKKLIITFHTSPDVYIHESKREGFGPRSMLDFRRKEDQRKSMIKQYVAPAELADLVITLNQLTEEGLINLGVKREKIKRLELPIPNTKNYLDESSEIRQGLNKKNGDIIYSTVGFMHRHKGVFDAIKALRFLPENYKLAIIGGVHPESYDNEIYNEFTDLVIELGLEERVYITGFVKDDNILNKLIRECDVCVYPYEYKYYSRVSSAALNLAFSNGVAVIGYPTQTFIDIAQDSQAILLTNGFSYYELARSLRAVDTTVLSKRSKKYAQHKSYDVITNDLIQTYIDVAT